MTVRQVRIAQAPRGFRSPTLVVVTTLLDPLDVSADEIRALHRDRWTVELNLRSLKTHLGMDVLRGQSQGKLRGPVLRPILFAWVRCLR